MSWTLSAAGHDVTGALDAAGKSLGETAEAMLKTELKDLFTKYSAILTSLTFAGSSGTINLEDVVHKDVVVPLQRELEAVAKPVEAEAEGFVEHLEDEVKAEAEKIEEHFSPPSRTP